MRTLRHPPTLALATVLVTGCGYDEGLTIADMHGTIVLPREAATRTIETPSGPQEVTDTRLIGPVYLGLYSEVVTGNAAYPAPAQGPAFQAGIPGDTYPYGGTSVGDIRFACVEFLTCKVASGRFVDFNAMVSWFNDTLQSPILDADGNVITNGDFIADQCYDLLNVTSPAEIRLTATSDKNEDGNIDAGDLDFVEQSDGTFAAEFTIYQQEYFQDEESGQGFSLWGWMDAPSEASAKFSTCDPEAGYQETEYNRDFFGGRPYRDLLNNPTQYITVGDWVSGTPHVYSSIDDADVTIAIDFPVEGQ